MPRHKEATTQITHAMRRATLSGVTWDNINEPGTYVERGSGNLYRFPKESLLSGAPPTLVKESRDASVLIKLSDDPFVTTFKARLLCARYRVEASF